MLVDGQCPLLVVASIAGVDLHQSSRRRAIAPAVHAISCVVGRMEDIEAARRDSLPSLTRSATARLQVHHRSTAGSRSCYAVRNTGKRDVVIAGRRYASVIEDPILGRGVIRR